MHGRCVTGSMSLTKRKLMESSKPVILKSTSALSLHERFSRSFSQVLLDQETGPSVMDPVLPQLKRAPEPRQWCGRGPGDEVASEEEEEEERLDTTGRAAGRGHLQRHLQTRTKVQRLTTGPHLSLNLPRGVASKRRRSQDDVPTKKQLDKQLDEYMSLSKKHLDKQLDNYMSLSKSRLDAELDEYMSMAGDTLSQWD
ncbi:hypothetical protein INR49_019702 [Caranx melampygus]|nr:hypothetical protein INR49_019702 [Caranx melampygus]